ncbi:hypothetical protein MPTK1_1g06760 [Marchantia polymorpha subsp. ruderalis]|uniref:Uncharacterized protein n=2 Tax=Marchantia polymorpha TaxID=3197 RepID=A0AAF6AMB1_MARPO|nr:hypothetical protein MARPO_0043s0068 [Marchantia polymorpha]BBM97581.1 hypothetical protein Mp_1g06760 [Marchantia polymorpha subsp. ruderalis]|eukprot:PTQ39822.1 hypothetical protein MARPO_0043s0068 [Marchantia polymorpha]
MSEGFLLWVLNYSTHRRTCASSYRYSSCHNILGGCHLNSLSLSQQVQTSELQVASGFCSQSVHTRTGVFTSIQQGITHL